MTKVTKNLQPADNEETELQKAIRKYGIPKFIKDSGIGRALVYAVVSGQNRFGNDNAIKAIDLVGVCQCCQQKVKK